MRIAFFLAASSLLLQQNVVAQSFTVYNYSVHEGFPSSEVYQVFQDSNGFLWFATDNGVAKFDGNRVERFHSKDGLTDPVVFSFFEDHKGRIWFRTYSSRLCYLEDGAIKKYPHNDKLELVRSKGVFNFTITPDDELVYACRKQFGRIDYAGNVTFDNVEGEGGYWRTVGDRFVMAPSHYSFPNTSIFIDSSEFKVTLRSYPFINPVLGAIRWRGRIYVSMNREVFEYDGKSLKKMLSAEHPVISLSLDKEDNLWIGYLGGGVEQYKTNTAGTSWKPEFLENKSVTSVLQDHEGGLWFSTLESGVFHVPNLMINHYQLPTNTRVRGILRLKDHVLVGDQGGNLVQVDVRTREIRQLEKLRSSLITIYNNGRKIFLSTNTEIKVYDQGMKLEKSYPMMASDFSTEQNGTTWGFGGQKMLRFDEQGMLRDRRNVHQLYRSIHAQDDLLFLAERTGLHILERNKEVPKVRREFTDIKISNIQKFNDSTLLITTIGNGFILFDTRKWTSRRFSTSNNFIADNVFSCLLDGKNLWLGTEKGLVKLATDQLYQSNPEFEYLTKKSGLIGDKIDFLLKVNDGIWAFSENNFSIVPESFEKFANERPLFYIDEIRVNDSIRTAAQLSHLNHRENTLKIAFGFISFNNQNILLRYRLSENDGWIYTNNKQLLFPSLSPGRYAFELQYSTNNVKWITAMEPLNFLISSPWWTKWYIQASALMAVVTIGFLYFRYQRSIYHQRNHYLRIINEHQQKLIQSEILTRERERNRISKELHDRVGTNLSAIKLTVNQLLKTHRDPLAEDVEEQFQVAIQEIKDIIYGLTPPGLERYGLFTGLKNYVGKLTRNIPINISLKTFGKDIHRYELNIIIFRVLQELLSNSIKHSFARNITVHINSFDDMLNIMFEDDGIGFSYDPEESGLGLDNVESRIRSMNGTLKFESGNFGISYTIDIPLTLNKEVV